MFSVAFIPVVESHPSNTQVNNVSITLSHSSPIVNLMTHSEVMHAVELGEQPVGSCGWYIYTNGQLPGRIMTVTRGVCFTLGYCLVMKKNDRGFDIQQDCGYV